MTELDELTEGKSLQELETELNYQLKMGESLGGTICSHIVAKINQLKISEDYYFDNLNKKL